VVHGNPQLDCSADERCLIILLADAHTADARNSVARVLRRQGELGSERAPKRVQNKFYCWALFGSGFRVLLDSSSGSNERVSSERFDSKQKHQDNLGENTTFSILRRHLEGFTCMRGLLRPSRLFSGLTDVATCY
jgi:hypothetical protein